MADVKVEIEWDGQEITAEVRRLLAGGLGDAAEYLLGVANELVPLDEGPLMHSGFTDVDEDDLQAVVGYDTVYAVRQHEEMDYQHAPGRQAKYLEEPWLGQREEMLELIAAPARRAM